MNGEYLFEKLEGIDPEFIMDAAKEPDRAVIKPFRRRQSLIGMAASFVVMVLAGAGLLLQLNSVSESGAGNEDASTAIATSGWALTGLLIVLCAAAAFGLTYFIIRMWKNR